MASRKCIVLFAFLVLFTFTMEVRSSSVSLEEVLQLLQKSLTTLKSCNYNCADTDDCASHPCKNNGTCTDRVNGFNCSCAPGFNGTQCETDIDDCASHPCKNNGTCTDRVNGFNCSCAPGFNGTQCETDIDECVSGVHDCHSSASCTNTVGSFNCSCNNGFTGNGKTCNLLTECQNYQTLTSADRNVNYRTTDRKCDDGLSGWYRFQGAAGTRMPTSCPSSDFHAGLCDSNIPGWLDDVHPTVAEGNATKQVCFHWEGNCCRWSIYIQVKNCGSFYVYYFNGVPACHARYCGSD